MVFLLLVFTVFFAGSLDYVHAASAPYKLIVGYAAINARVSPLWISEEQGYLAKYGLQVEQVYLRGAPTLVAGLASGDIQLGRSGGSATLAAIGAGHDFKIVATFSTQLLRFNRASQY